MHRLEPRGHRGLGFDSGRIHPVSSVNEGDLDKTRERLPQVHPSVAGFGLPAVYLGDMLPPSARLPIWDDLTVDLGEDVTPEDAHAFVRLLNRPEGQAYLWKVAESLVRLRKTTKRRKFQPAKTPVVDPAALPFLTVEEAAGLLRTTVDGVYARVDRGQLTGVERLVREGRKVLFHREKLLRSLERAADGRATRRGRR